MGGSIGSIPLNRIHPDGRYRLRADVGEDLDALLTSVRAVGVVQPVVVERAGRGFVLRQGHRRVAAAVLAGLDEVPAVVCDRPVSETEWLLQAAAESASVRVLGMADKQRLAGHLRRLGCSWRQVASAFKVAPKTVGGWVCDDDEPLFGRARSANQRAIRRLVAVHGEEFDRLLLEERQGDVMVGVAA